MAPGHEEREKNRSDEPIFLSARFASKRLKLRDRIGEFAFAKFSSRAQRKALRQGGKNETDG